MIGSRLQLSRKKMKISQRELADLIGCARNTVSFYERGITTPSDKVKVNISKTLNISLDYLLGIIDIPLPPQKAKRVIEINEKITNAEFASLQSAFDKCLEEIKKNGIQ